MASYLAGPGNTSTEISFGEKCYCIPPVTLIKQIIKTTTEIPRYAPSEGWVVRTRFLDAMN